MTPDATSRFSNRVQDYARFRPGYPPALVTLLAREACLTPDSVIADIGSGTGLLSRPFLDAGYSVIGVEPNRDMRQAGDTLLAAYPRFRSLDARAETTTLPDHSADLALAGQAFHWFDPVATRTEWLRILKPRAISALIWNERHAHSPLMRDVEDVIEIFAAEMDPDGAIREAGQSRIPGFFAPAPFRAAEFFHDQHLDREGLIGRVASSSFLPGRGHPRYSEMEAQLNRIFDRHCQANRIVFQYRAKVFRGQLDYSGV